MQKNWLSIGLVAFVTAMGITLAKADDARPSFYDIRSYGAVAGGETKCTKAISDAMTAALEKGGGTIFIPAGVFLTGPIHLRSHITLYLDAGAILKFSTNFDDYLPMVPSRWEGIEVTNFSPLIYAQNATDITICGRGTLDGQGRPWWNALSEVKRANGKNRNKWQAEFARLNPHPMVGENYKGTVMGFLRPPFIQPLGCTNVLIEDVTIINSPFWTVSPLYCEDVNIHGVTIRNPDPSPNTDGIDPDSCHNVRISDCNISVGDDCVTIKSGRDADGRRVGRPAENYSVVNCTMERGHGGVVIGSEMSGNVKDITIANCVFDGTDRGIRIKAARGRGGIVENVRVSNIIMRNVRREAVILTTFYEQSEPEPVGERTPIFRNIHLNGITGNAKIAGDFTGLTEMPLENVSLEDAQIQAETGFNVKDARDIQFRNIRLSLKSGPAVVADEANGLEISGFHFLPAKNGELTVELGKVKRVFIHGCMARPEHAGFIKVLEGSANEVIMSGNDFGKAGDPVAKVANSK